VIDVSRLRVAAWLARDGDGGMLREFVDELQLEPEEFDQLTLLGGLVLVSRVPEGRPGEGAGDPAAIEELVSQALYDALLLFDAHLAQPLPWNPLRFPQPASPALTALATRHGLEGGLYTGWPLD
jgi:hypothetical protein